MVGIPAVTVLFTVCGHMMVRVLAVGVVIVGVG